MRKAHYVLNLKLKSDDEAPALAFGSAIHKALEHWYSLPFDQRVLAASSTEAVKLLAHGDCSDPLDGAAESIRQYVLRARPSLSGIADGDMRSVSHGIKVLIKYMQHYANDEWEVARDDKGPIIERELQATIHEEPGLTVNFHGTIDVVLQSSRTGIKLPADHKTSYSLGSEFYQRIKPNPQYTGYVWLAKQCLGIDGGLFMVNGIQTAKTKQEFARQVTDRNDEDFAELKSSVVCRVLQWLEALKRDEATADIKRAYPQSAPNPCTMYGGCAFRTVCEVPDKLKANVMSAQWRSVSA